MALIEQFAAYQRLCGFTPATIRRRTATLRQLARAGALTRVTVGDLESFLGGKSPPTTRHAYRSDLRAFYSWATERGHTDSDPTSALHAIKVPHGLPRPLNVDDLQGAIAAATGDVRLMLMLGAYAGLRRMEIAALDADDVRDGLLVVRGGKGGKDRVVPLHPALAAALADRTGPVFPTHSPESVGRLIARHLRACGINATAHQLRHTFGTELARVSGGDVLVVGEVMGHSSATTTLGYTRLALGRASAAVGQMYGAA